MNPLLISTAAVFSLYSIAAWVKDRVAHAGNPDKASVASSASQRRNQAAQLCAT
jgi:hypothetical protein